MRLQECIIGVQRLRGWPAPIGGSAQQHRPRRHTDVNPPCLDAKLFLEHGFSVVSKATLCASDPGYAYTA